MCKVAELTLLPNGMAECFHCDVRHDTSLCPFCPIVASYLGTGPSSEDLTQDERAELRRQLVFYRPD